MEQQKERSRAALREQQAIVGLIMFHVLDHLIGLRPVAQGIGVMGKAHVTWVLLFALDFGWVHASRYGMVKLLGIKRSIYTIAFMPFGII